MIIGTDRLIAYYLAFQMAINLQKKPFAFCRKNHLHFVEKYDKLHDIM